jgi:dTDP-4-dehydrorhamnose 3,5-epimerase
MVLCCQRQFFSKNDSKGYIGKKEYLLKDNESMVLEIPGGHYNGFETLEEESVLMVFSDFGLEESKRDDFRELLESIKW